ncbi:hypothetical protein T440DRAFT_470573 [Plenodomus tracheiphilus IPT5]|uniref:Uncharacterized protein n=1 Tax=Plenodomus tracheiphilus IPT5 TaxID=1408161 RepID=A0A6A7AYT5_9PLEO|nr:hypothetical protein T440DRAFT_470573 [Plenodomus tracheiphilus IPT5]
MGIPIGWNIKRDEPKERDVLRADLTGQRSPIRRRARPQRSPRPQSASDSDFGDILVYTSRREADDLGQYARPSHARTRLAPPPVPEVSRTDYRSNESSREPPTLQRAASSLRRTRSRLGRLMHAYQRSNVLEPLPALTPGFAPAAGLQEQLSEAARADTQRPDGMRNTRMRNTQNYPRAGPPRLLRSRNGRAASASATRGDFPEGLDDAHDNGDNNAVGFPPLRRMGRRTIADGPLPSSSLRESWSPLDGLGDRERSISPFDEQSPWDTFVSMIMPDPVAPTAESSFASAAASASFSDSHPSSRAGSSNSATSSQTHLTVPSRRDSLPQNEQFMRACDTSDDDTASDTEEDEPVDAAPVPAWRRQMDYRNQAFSEAVESRRRIIERRRQVAVDALASHRRMRPSYFSDEPPMRDSERYSRRVLERSREASAYVRNLYDRAPPANDENNTQLEQLDGPVDDQTSAQTSAGEDDTSPIEPAGTSPLDQELRDARSLLERLSRRGDISDDFWASVGLSRSFADPVERFQERERL